MGRLSLMLALLACVLLPHRAEAAFSYYKIGTIDATQCGTADSTNFPVGIVMTDADLKTTGNGGKVTSANGYDIRPYADRALTTALTYELVSYTASTGQVEMWFNQATLSHTVNGTVYLAFGNAALSTDGSSNATWDTNFKAVWHLKDGTTLALTDSTSNANSGTNHSATATSGQVDGGAHFTAASSQYVDMGSGASLAITGALTIEGWVLLDSLPAISRLLGREAVASNLGYVVFFTGASPNFSFTLQIYTGTGTSGVASLTTFGPSTWVYVAATIDSAKNGVVYLNGAQDNTGVFTTLPLDSATTLLLGARNDLTRFLDGKLDEVRVSNTNRSASYVTASYNNQKPSSTFLTWSALVVAGQTCGARLLLGVGC